MRRTETESGQKPRLSIVCQVEIYREGVASLLSRSHAFGTIATFSAPEEVPCGAPSTEEVVLIDAALVRTESVDLLNNRSTRTSVVALGVSVDEDDAMRCLAAGVHGLHYAGAGIDELVRGILLALDGVTYCTPQLVTSIADHVLAHVVPKRGSQCLLTAREQEVASLMNKGCSNAKIAKELDITYSTVKAHIQNIRRKVPIDYCRSVPSAL